MSKMSSLRSSSVLRECVHVLDDNLNQYYYKSAMSGVLVEKLTS